MTKLRKSTVRKHLTLLTPVATTPATVARLRVRGVLPLLAVVVFALGIAQGLLRSADLVTNETTTETLAHTEGRVAGATVAIGAGTARLQIIADAETQEYVVTLPSALSLFNVLRLAQQQTSASVVTQIDERGRAFVQSAGGQAAPTGFLRVRLNDEEAGDLDVTMVAPGDTVTIVR